MESSNSFADNLNVSFDFEIETVNSEDVLWAEGYKSLIEELKEKV